MKKREITALVVARLPEGKSLTRDQEQSIRAGLKVKLTEVWDIRMKSQHGPLEHLEITVQSGPFDPSRLSPEELAEGKRGNYCVRFDELDKSLLMPVFNAVKAAAAEFNPELAPRMKWKDPRRPPKEQIVSVDDVFLKRAA